jgi:hypothetical protein
MYNTTHTHTYICKVAASAVARQTTHANSRIFTKQYKQHVHKAYICVTSALSVATSSVSLIFKSPFLPSGPTICSVTSPGPWPQICCQVCGALRAAPISPLRPTPTSADETACAKSLAAGGVLPAPVYVISICIRIFTYIDYILCCDKPWLPDQTSCPNILPPFEDALSCTFDNLCAASRQYASQTLPTRRSAGRTGHLWGPLPFFEITSCSSNSCFPRFQLVCCG